MSLRGGLCTASLSAFVLVVAAAPAGAATIATTTPCVTSFGGVKSVGLVGTGFTPGRAVLVRATNPDIRTPSLMAQVQADAAGSFPAGTLGMPALFSSFSAVDETFTLTARDDRGIEAAPSTFRQVFFGFRAVPGTARRGGSVRYTARGFVSGRPVYAHFRFAGRTRRTVRLGVARAPCGIVSRRMRQLPAKARIGRWTVAMDHERAFRSSTVLQARGNLHVSRTGGSSRDGRLED
jgi:hypothetical protein